MGDESSTNSPHMSTPSLEQIGIGIIGCGKISQAYFDGAKTFDVLKIVACADLNEAVAQAKATENGCAALSIEALLAHPDIQLVINLTIPATHGIVSRDILNAGKHVYCEKPLPVEVNTHASGTLVFHSGAIITAVFSFDVVQADHSPIQLYGTEGSLKVPDPNTFGGPVFSYLRGDSEWTDHPLTRPYVANTRSIGVADMARAILSGRAHRASGALAVHVLEVMHAFDQSSASGQTIQILSRPERPAALPAGLAEGELD